MKNFLMRRHLGDLFLVCAGGVIGSILRVGITAILEPRAVLAIFLCNVFGSFLFTLFIDFERVGRPRLKKFHNAGFCGGLTTFSAFAIQVAGLAHSGHVGYAVGLFAATFAACLLAASLSRPCARAFFAYAGGRK